jgi:RNA polymerase sigma-54 factor
MLQLRQSQSLQQRLTPQQVQYLKLLQLPILSLEQRIKSEIEENPMLEEATDDDDGGLEAAVDPDREAETLDASPDRLNDTPGFDETPAELLARETRQQDNERKDEATEQAQQSDAAQNEYTLEDFINDDGEGFKSPTANHNSDDEREEMPHAAGQSFLETLYAQVTMLNLSGSLRALAEEIIGSLDDDGYLRVPLEQIVKDASVFYGEEYTLQQAESLLKRLQKLDPAGVASRDLRECLLVQLDVMSNHNPTKEVARKIIAERFDDFVNKRYTALSRHLGMEQHDLKAAIDLIQRLNPKPGASAGTMVENTKYITADFYIEKTPDGKDFTIVLNERGVPPLRVNAAYKDLVRKSPERGRALTPEAKDFIKKKFEAAKFFIMAIYQRRDTMMRVMHSIITHQRKFFDQGEKYLKPLIYKTIAEDIHMDISTICRVVNGKYCQTDFGVFELKYFFSESIPTDGGEGEAVANKVVKSRIKDIIGAEAGGDPLSDEKIVHLLNEEGFGVARRTVAKYREQMNIPVARLRKKLM